MADAEPSEPSAANRGAMELFWFRIYANGRYLYYNRNWINKKLSIMTLQSANKAKDGIKCLYKASKYWNSGRETAQQMLLASDRMRIEQHGKPAWFNRLLGLGGAICGPQKPALPTGRKADLKNFYNQVRQGGEK